MRWLLWWRVAAPSAAAARGRSRRRRHLRRRRRRRRQRRRRHPTRGAPPGRGGRARRRHRRDPRAALDRHRPLATDGDSAGAGSQRTCRRSPSASSARTGGSARARVVAARSSPHCPPGCGRGARQRASPGCELERIVSRHVGPPPKVAIGRGAGRRRPALALPPRVAALPRRPAAVGGGQLRRVGVRAAAQPLRVGRARPDAVHARHLGGVRARRRHRRPARRDPRRRQLPARQRRARRRARALYHYNPSSDYVEGGVPLRPADPGRLARLLRVLRLAGCTWRGKPVEPGKGRGCRPKHRPHGPPPRRPARPARRRRLAAGLHEVDQRSAHRRRHVGVLDQAQQDPGRQGRWPRPHPHVRRRLRPGRGRRLHRGLRERRQGHRRRRDLEQDGRDDDVQPRRRPRLFPRPPREDHVRRRQGAQAQDPPPAGGLAPAAEDARALLRHRCPRCERREAGQDRDLQPQGQAHSRRIVRRPCRRSSWALAGCVSQVGGTIDFERRSGAGGGPVAWRRPRPPTRCCTAATGTLPGRLPDGKGQRGADDLRPAGRPGVLVAVGVAARHAARAVSKAGFAYVLDGGAGGSGRRCRAAVRRSWPRSLRDGSRVATLELLGELAPPSPSAPPARRPRWASTRICSLPRPTAAGATWWRGT